MHDGQLVLLLVILAIVAVSLMRPRWRGSGTAFGTARVASKADLRRAGMLGSNQGLILGRTQDGELIRMRRYVHLSIFAPTSAGKGVSFVVPWLRSWFHGSAVVLDPKGENYRLTAKERRRRGQTVVRLDPFEVCGPGADSFNPLALIGSGEDGVDDARTLGEAMVIRTGEEKDPHWNDQSANVITGFLAFILASLRDEERNLASLREMVTQGDLCDATVAGMQAKGGVYARLAGVIAQLKDNEKAGVLSTVHRHTTFLDSPAIIASLSSSSFDARELLKGNMTIYLILPPHQLESQSRWLRLVTASLLSLIMREGTQENKR